MYTYKTTKQPKNTIEITIDLQWTGIENEYAKSFDVIHKDFAFEGFRKGKVPKELAEKHIAKDTVYNHMIRQMLPNIYADIVEKDKLQPIVSPKIEIVKAKENENWEVKMTVAEKPTVELGKYKEAIIEAKKDLKKNDLILPGQEEKTPEAKAEEKKQAEFQAVLTTLMKEVKCEIADVIIEEELNNRLSRLVDDIQKIGLTVENYFKSKNTTMDEVKEQIKKEIEETYKLEFILQEIADVEKIQIEDAEINKLFEGITDEKQKEMARQQAYYYASIMRKQKTLDFLTNL